MDVIACLGLFLCFLVQDWQEIRLGTYNTAVSNIEEKRGMLFVRGANISERQYYSFFACLWQRPDWKVCILHGQVDMA